MLHRISDVFSSARGLDDGAGRHFDPAIVDVVMRLHRRGDLSPTNWQALRPMRRSGLPAPVPVRR